MNSKLFKQNPDSSTTNSDGTEKYMSDASFMRLRDVIYKKSGIYYTESKKYLLEGRIAKRLQERSLKTYDQYIDYMESPKAKNEIHQLFEAVTINETYFFRAESQFEAFEKIIVPEIMKNKSKIRNNIFRVWSAASSTGEEAYTLAILFLEKLRPMFPGLQFQILASDINNAVLDNARKGVYKEYAIRNVPKHLLLKYFRQSGDKYILNDEVKKLVKFMNINLYDEQAMRMITACDIIFCCNVLIYFDAASKQQVISHLYNSLNKGGYLFIGYSESLHGISKAFKLIHLPKAMAYKKE
jgi:chemotaxis protein methyltransferase CheR